MSSTQPLATPPTPFDSTDRTGPPQPAGAATWLMAVLGPLVVWVGGVALAALVSSPHVAEGQCEGIGFGCTLSPRDGVVLSGVIVGIVLVPVLTLVTILSAALGKRRAGTIVRWVLGVFSAVVAFLVVVAAVSPASS